MPLAVFWAWLGVKLSFAYFVRHYPYDGLDGLSALACGMTAGSVGAVISFVMLFTLQRNLALRQGPD